MSDLISRQALREGIEKIYGCDWQTLKDVVHYAHVIDDLPSVEPERKKGKWIEVYGYASPGDDPVWKCSECGKGIHVYGIEAPSYNRDYTDGHQWVACPNCGAEMTRGE